MTLVRSTVGRDLASSFGKDLGFGGASRNFQMDENSLGTMLGLFDFLGKTGLIKFVFLYLRFFEEYS